MKHFFEYPKILVALLALGSAISLLSCGGEAQTASEEDSGRDDALVTATVRNMEVISSKNGLRTQTVRSPLVEDHSLAASPYQEHPEGIELIGYDSLGVSETSHVTSDYALHWVDRDLWELRGNVNVKGEGGRELYTQQLFWDVKLEIIYSNVDSRLVDGANMSLVEGFRSDQNFNDYTFRKLDGKFRVETSSTETSPAETSPIEQTPTEGVEGESTPTEGKDGEGAAGPASAAEPTPEASPTMIPTPETAPASGPEPTPKASPVTTSGAKPASLSRAKSASTTELTIRENQ